MNETMRLPNEREDGSSPVINRELIMHYLDCSEQGVLLSENDRDRFIGTAIACQLNPFKREIHMRFSQEQGMTKMRIITGYEVYLRKADQTGLLDGWTAWTEGSGDGMRAIVEIRRKDWGNPFIHEAYWSEAAQKNEDGRVSSFWERMPRFQLKKVAISQGFRLCFANEIGGMPYEGAELPDFGMVSSKTTGRASIPEPGIAKRHIAPVKDSSVVGLAAEIHALAMEHKSIISETHLEWIENQLSQEKTEPQLKGLLKHVQQAIEAGGDANAKPKRTESKRSYPGSGRKVILPVNQARPAQIRGVPIF